MRERIVSVVGGDLMKILITNTGPWGTGSGTVADGVMQELLKLGHQVKAFFPDSGFPGEGVAKYYGNMELYRIVKFPVNYKGVSLYTFPLIITDPNPRNYHNAWTLKELSEVQLAAYFAYLREELKKLLDEFQPDVVECQHIWAIDHIVQELGYPYICIAHHSDQMGFCRDTRVQHYAKESAKQAGQIIAISEYVKTEVMELYGVSEDKVSVSPNGFNKDIFCPRSLKREEELARLGLSDLVDIPLITFCGKVSTTKGIDVLLRANRLVQQQHKVAIILMGSGNLEELCQSINSPYSLENVINLGHRSQEDLAILHNLARFSVMPSRSEGFGIAALEAMGCGIPVVATQVGGLGDFVVGRLIKPENEIALSDAIIEMLELESKQYEELCTQAREIARHYSWESIVRRRVEIYEQVLNKLNENSNESI